MAIDMDRLLNRHFPPVEQTYTPRDTMLYALGVGLGADPLDPGQLRFVYERELQALPTMACVLAGPGFWADQPDTGIDWRRLVHAEQSFTLHRPLRPEGRVVGENRVSALYDKGAAKGALLCQERIVRDAGDGAPVATVSQVSMLRGDGGFGGPQGGPPPLPPVPDHRAADAVCDLPTLPQAALIYRLSGDRNPLHADPEVAAAAGFPRPILHGLCTMGIACHAVLRGLLGYDAAAVRGMRVRFTAPVLPGDTIRTEMWKEDGRIAFRSHAVERGVTVLGTGSVELWA